MSRDHFTTTVNGKIIARGNKKQHLEGLSRFYRRVFQMQIDDFLKMDLVKLLEGNNDEGNGV